MNKNQKRNLHCDSGTSTSQIFALLDTVQSDKENEIHKLMNDSDTEFIAPEEIELTGNPDNASVVTPGANVHVVGKGTTHTKQDEKARRKYTNHMEMQGFSTSLTELSSTGQSFLPKYFSLRYL